MIRLEYKITIERFPTIPNQADLSGQEFLTLPFVTECEIDSKLDSLTNTAYIRFPMIYAFKRGNHDLKNYIAGNTETIFELGQKVVIQAGYDYYDGKGPQLNTLFTGYIANVIPNAMVEIYCEDASWKLKQCDNKGFVADGNSNLTLKTLLTGILPSWCLSGANILDATLGGYRVKKGNSVAFELDRLRESGLTIEFDQNGNFRAGLRYLNTNPSSVTKSEFKYELNVISDDGMVYRRGDQMNVCVKATSVDFKNNVIPNDGTTNAEGVFTNAVPLIIDKNGVHISKSYADGKIYGQTINYKGYGFTLDTLKTFAQEVYDRTVFEGFTGNIETFLQPVVYPGNAVKLISDKVPEKGGIYLVKGVYYYFGIEGGRQKISLDKKISDT